MSNCQTAPRTMHATMACRASGHRVWLALSTIIAALAMLSRPIAACNFDHEHNYGDMTGDSWVRRGTDFVITCNLNNQMATIGNRTFAVDSSMIRFKFMNELVANSRVDIVNATAAQTSIRAADFDDTGYYFCFLYVQQAPVNMSLVCASQINVGCEFILYAFYRHGLCTVRACLLFVFICACPICHSRALPVMTFRSSPRGSRIESAGCCVTMRYASYFILFDFNPFFFVFPSFRAVPPTDIATGDFRCISMHYQNLTCSFRAPDYHLKTSYAIEELTYAGLARRCPIVLNATACAWNLTSVPGYRQHEDELTFKVTSINWLGKHTQHFRIDHFAVIKPGPVSVTLASQSPTSVGFKWQVPEHFDEENIEDQITPRLVYEILISREHPWPEGDPSRTISVGHAREYNATGLIPFTQYVFSFRCKTTRPNSIWSDYVNTTLTTKDDGN